MSSDEPFHLPASFNMIAFAIAGIRAVSGRLNRPLTTVNISYCFHFYCFVLSWKTPFCSKSLFCEEKTCKVSLFF